MSWRQRWKRWLYKRRGYDVLSLKIHVSKELLDDRNPVTADLIATIAEERAREATLKRMGLVPS